MRQISNNISKQRLIKFQEIAEKIKIKYKKSLLNKKSLVLFENRVRNKNNVFFGRDEFSNSVIVRSKENLIGMIKEVKIIDGNQNTLFGEIDKQYNKKEFAA